MPAPGEDADGADRQAADVGVEDPYELGQEFFRWEFATAVAGSILGINPFDQPNVQEAKDRTGAILERGGTIELEPEGSLDELLAQARARATTSRSRRSSTRAREASSNRSSTRAREHAAVSSRRGSGRATCTRPGSCTRAGRTRACMSRSSTTR